MIHTVSLPALFVNVVRGVKVRLFFLRFVRTRPSGVLGGAADM